MYAASAGGPLQPDPALGDVEQLLADYVVDRRLLRVEPGVVVALEDEAVALDGDDAVQDDGLEHGAVISRHLADVVVRRGHDYDEVSCGHPWLHGDADSRNGGAETEGDRGSPGDQGE